MMTTFDWFSRWARYNPNKIAFEEFETKRKLSYLQINNLANYLSNWILSKFNLVKGDRIAVLAENQLEYVLLFAVAQKTGLILVPMNYRLAEPEIQYLLEQSKPSLIFVQNEFKTKISVKHQSYIYAIEKLAEISDEKQDHTFEFKNETIEENHPLFLIFTSGTTSFPKGSIYTHKMLYWNAINTFLRLDINSADRAINCAPPFHTGGWNVLQTPFILHGAYTLLMRNFNADEVLKILSHDKHTIFWAVPTMLKMMRQSANYESANFSNIRYFIVGGEAMPIPEIQEWNKKGVAIRQGYGLTEVGPNVTSLNQEDAIRKQGSIGFPNFYYDIKITDEKGHEVKAGESGELWLKGPTVTTGYWNNLEATLDTITDGWFHTGDVVRMDEEGFLYIVDRIKNMYISGGENVYPAEVEHTLRQHPSIEQVAIIGVPDEKWGESGKAFIKRKNNISKEEILDFCRQKLAKYKIPKHIEFIEQLPLNDSGKIDRKKLKENQQ